MNCCVCLAATSRRAASSNAESLVRAVSLESQVYTIVCILSTALF